MNTKYRWLVTGGAGFIGSHLAEYLYNNGQYVRVLDDFSSGKEENLSFAPNVGAASGREKNTFDLIRGDIRNKETCLKACDGIDYVLHQAALRSVPKSMSRPHEYNAVNIDGTINVLDSALRKGVLRVVLASSSSIYGDTSKFPQGESDTPLLISPYALTKLAAEYYSRVYSINHGLETVNLRYFNVFGPRQSLDDEYAVVIPKFITCMLNDESPPVHGDGTQSRDFTYIDNIVQANILSATAANLKCEVFNVACGSDNSILDIVNSVNKIINKDIKPKFEPSRQGDVKRTLANVDKIKRLTGFQPRVSFEEGLKTTVEWFSNNLLLQKA
ncbi:NAD-dependent epimerase/dehydratase family protein [Candidatus Omnitrophota bacterium]